VTGIVQHVWLTTSRQDRSVLSASTGNVEVFQGGQGIGGVGNATGITMLIVSTVSSAVQINLMEIWSQTGLLQIRSVAAGQVTGTALTVMHIVLRHEWSASSVASLSPWIFRLMTETLLQLDFLG